MNKLIPSLLAAALAAGGFVPSAGAGEPPPPPPPQQPASTSTPSPSAAGKYGGAGGRFAEAAAQRMPVVGLIKEVEEKGKVTKEEFLEHAKKQAEESFAKLDKNNDGVIDKSEVAEIEGKLKGAREKMRERGKTGPRQRPGADDKKPTT
jgi:hypothetical protein